VRSNAAEIESSIPHTPLSTPFISPFRIFSLHYQLDQKYQQRAGGTAGGSGEQLTPAELNARYGFTDAMQQQQYTEQMRKNQLQMSQQRVPNNQPAYYATLQQQQLILLQQRAEMQQLARQQAQEKQQLQLQLQSTVSPSLAAQGATDDQIYQHLKREMDLQTEKFRQQLILTQARHSAVAQQASQQQQQLQLRLQQHQQQQQQQQMQLLRGQQQQMNQQQMQQQQQRQQQAQPTAKREWKDSVTNADRTVVMRRIQLITAYSMEKLQTLEHAYILQSTSLGDYMSEEMLNKYLVSKK
jgi:hypothetical protein